ncbi:DUF2071 domain-containing protein [Lentisphaera marina]|uniref:YqjF family protein n=1 Tax=Lentisphaera marina TaxID=1111041 RepID=UPI0023660FE6|nr:DUF2071 domain-containing protein [Lentisphaera marina]MDD7985834.1 DUF2071 domain-containing protein [Lentisphaera marina]
MKFLHAHWNNLILASYKIDPKSLEAFIPFGTELDFHDGDCYVSLVAFMFHDTRICNLAIPGHINFEEVNLRFYVRPKYDPTKRSVVFIKEIVPKKAIEVIANSLFYENYFTTKMDHHFNGNDYSYSWLNKGVDNSIKVTSTDNFYIPKAGSIQEFITEHYWGYTKANTNTLEYEVKHDQWEVCDINSYEVNVDFEKNYGSIFGILNDKKADNICFSKGSYIEVNYGKKIRT